MKLTHKFAEKDGTGLRFETILDAED